jgi:hypothetical protein
MHAWWATNAISTVNTRYLGTLTATNLLGDLHRSLSCVYNARMVSVKPSLVSVRSRSVGSGNLLSWWGLHHSWWYSSTACSFTARHSNTTWTTHCRRTVLWVRSLAVNHVDCRLIIASLMIKSDSLSVNSASAHGRLGCLLARCLVLRPR